MSYAGWQALNEDFDFARDATPEVYRAQPTLRRRSYSGRMVRDSYKGMSGLGQKGPRKSASRRESHERVPDRRSTSQWTVFPEHFY